MKAQPEFLAPWLRFCRIALLGWFSCLLAAFGAHAGLTMQISINRGNYQGDQYYQFAPNIFTNGTPPLVAYGDYCVVSPGWPTNANAAYYLYHFDDTGFNQIVGNSPAFSQFDAPDFADSLIQNITNGLWTIFVTNTVTTNTYYFTVASSINSNTVPLIVITSPTNGAVDVPEQPAFTWQGATNFTSQIFYAPNFGDSLPPTQTSFSGLTLLEGLNQVTVDTYLDVSTGLVASVAIDSHSNPISSWVSAFHVWDYANIQFTVGAPDSSGTAHTLVAHYTWDTMNLDGSASGADSSGNGYNMDVSGSYGSAGGENWTATAAAGPGANQFHDGDQNSGGYAGWSSMPAGLLNALAGSFSVCCWVNTTQSIDYGGDYAYNGAGVVSAYTGGLAYDTVPIALTGGQVAFNTGGTEDDTLTSSGSVNDGNYHFVVVTRNQATGQKTIYIDGQFDSFSSGTTNLLGDCQALSIGSMANATDPFAADATYYNGYDGLVDDLQVYSGVLSGNEVAELYNNPGAPATNITSQDTLAASASPVSGPVPLTVQFYSAATDSLGNAITSWNWSFGDGGTSTDQNPSYTYATAGSYTPSLTVYSAAGPAPFAASGLGTITVTAAAPPTGLWSKTGSFPLNERSSFPLTTLPSGQVLASGGEDDSGYELTTAYESDLYNPATGAWQASGYLYYARQNHSATLLTNGLVLAAGGQTVGLGGQGAMSSCELYSPATGLWTPTGALNSKRFNHVAVLLTNGLVLVAGGISNSTTIATAELYSPAAGAWAYTGTMNQPRNGAAAVLLTNGTVLVVGGQDTNNNSLATAEIYNPLTKQWRLTSGAMLDAAASFICQLLPDGQVLVAGGTDASGVTGFSELYDPGSDTWIQTGSLNTPRSGAGSVLLANGVVLAAGGYGNTTLTNAELYAPNNGIWTATGAMKEGRYGLFPMVLLASGQALATGGFASGNDISGGTAELYATTLQSFLLTHVTIPAGGGILFSFTNTPGAGSTVFATTNLSLPFTNWTTLGSATEVAPGQFQFTDTQSNLARRFYRVRSP